MQAYSNYNENLNYTKTFNVGIYLRLSKEDEMTSQSESISNQREYVTSYVVEQGWNIIDVYIDDGYSGLNFERPAFKKMLSDIENEKINLVITKDLSRLGRDYIDTGNYLERYFPQMNVRYIALNDGIDTFSNNSNNDMSPFKSVINDMYAKDISKKIRSVMDTKRKNGQFIGAFAPYGYKKDPLDKNRFIIDDEVVDIVKRIFNSYLQGKSMCAITNSLNDENIHCPAKYKSLTSTYKNAMVKRYLWTQETIKRILTNPSYMGNMAQGRQVKINYKLDKFRKIPRSDWIIAEDTHEPIVLPDDFYTVQELIQKKIVHYDKGEKATHLLNGLTFCKDCGAKVTYRRNSSKKMIAQCMTYSKHGPRFCSSHRVQESILDKIVIEELKKVSNEVLKDQFYEKFESIKPEKNNNIDKEFERINKKLNETKEVIKSLYVDKVKGLIDEEMFMQMSKDYNVEKENLSKRYMELVNEKKALNDSDKETDYIEVIKQIANFDEVDKVTLTKLIDRIEISEEKEIFIYYIFKNPFSDDEKVL